MIVTFEDYVPIPRYDGDPFTHVLILEAATVDGIYSQIDDLPLNPLDPDPANPMVRNFTTQNGTAEDMWYKLRWLDASGDAVDTESIQNAQPEVQEYQPYNKQVAAHIRARTKDANGVELGYFTSQTRPTDEQVADIALKAASDVSKTIGDDIPNVLIGEAQSVSALRAAMLIELSYYPEQIRSGRSPYAELKQLYDEELERLRLAVIGAADGTVDVQPSPVDQASGDLKWPIQGGAHFGFDDRRLTGGARW